MKDCIDVYEEAFSVEDCEWFIEQFHELEKQSIMVNSSIDNHKVDHVEANLHHFYHLPAWSSIGTKFFDGLTPLLKDYAETYSILGNVPLMYYDVKVKKIPPGGGYHAWHFENSALVSASRMTVVQLYLNTIDEGGETEFLYMNKRIPAVQGRVVIFPSAYPYTHRGNPPIGQTKYILTTWGIMQSE